MSTENDNSLKPLAKSYPPRFWHDDEATRVKRERAMVWYEKTVNLLDDLTDCLISAMPEKEAEIVAETDMFLSDEDNRLRDGHAFNSPNCLYFKLYEMIESFGLKYENNRLQPADKKEDKQQRTVSTSSATASTAPIVARPAEELSFDLAFGTEDGKQEKPLMRKV